MGLVGATAVAKGQVNTKRGREREMERERRLERGRNMHATVKGKREDERRCRPAFKPSLRLYSFIYGMKKWIKYALTNSVISEDGSL